MYASVSVRVKSSNTSCQKNTSCAILHSKLLAIADNRYTSQCGCGATWDDCSEMLINIIAAYQSTQMSRAKCKKLVQLECYVRDCTTIVNIILLCRFDL